MLMRYRYCGVLVIRILSLWRATILLHGGIGILELNHRRRNATILRLRADPVLYQCRGARTLQQLHDGVTVCCNRSTHNDAAAP